MMTTRQCTKCEQHLPHEEFGKRNNGQFGLAARCRACERIRRNEWQRSNPDKMKVYARISKLKMKYGLSSEMYQNMLEDQNYKCVGCQVHIDDYKQDVFHVDHCHDTNKVRGLLCGNCNTSLGLVKENINTLNNLIGYIKEHNDRDC